MKRCTLCGGKLNSEKRCTFCGLDNTKNDDMYKKMINRNSCEKEPLTHVHEEPAARPAKTRPQTMKQNPERTGQKTYTYNKPKYGNGSAKNVKKAAGCSAVVGLIPIIIAAIGILSSVFDVFSDLSLSTPEPDYQLEEESYDAYQWIIDEMPEEGEAFTASLDAGIYEVGYHIPMGIYQIELECDYGTIEVRDDFNGIYLSEYLDAYAERTTMEDVQLFNGAYLIVYTGTTVTMQTNNAQELSIIGTPNASQEAVKLEGELIVGQDIQPGAYDIRYKPVDEESSFVDIEIVAENLDYGFHMSFGSEMGEEVFYNVPLPEGAYITVENDYMENVEYLELVPSVATTDTDLNDFYYAY